MDIKKEFISSIINTLKIDNNPFNYGLLEDLIKNVKTSEYREFYNLLFGEDKNYMNGLDRAKTVSQHFNRQRNLEQISIKSEFDLFFGRVLGMAKFLKDTSQEESSINLQKASWGKYEKEYLTEKQIDFIKKRGGIIKMANDYKSELVSIDELLKDYGFNKDLMFINNVSALLGYSDD